MERIPPSQRLAEQMSDLLGQGLAAETGQTELRGALIRVGMQQLLEELLKAEQRDFLGVGRYERGQARQGQRNGYEPVSVETGEGKVELQAPQVRKATLPFESKLLGFLKGRTETVERLVTELYAHGLSTRDIEQAFTDATGQTILSKSAVSEVTERLWAEY